ncbi:hypothetical protein BRADI_5g08880v3 [Brachypodium distachyon]|uniref:GRF-type domain-containing protein n=1 Tax=Brachypodium distachyon TaxID=15368 RepID=I1IXC4_BRADI|nr:hypothetical protein BRADI_5g08880v3 [Brachypodium distachyon]
MSSSGSSYRLNKAGHLLLDKCPFCGEGEVEVITSSQPGTRGQHFYKCQLHTGTKTGCRFFKTEEVCAKFLAKTETTAQHACIPEVVGRDAMSFEVKHFAQSHEAIIRMEMRLQSMEHKIDSLKLMYYLLSFVLAVLICYR